MTAEHHDFRSDVRDSLRRARKELDSEVPERLRYAALELRFALEALTYERAQSYAAELPPQEYHTWQPRKLMAVLVEIDPSAFSSGTLFAGLEEEYGKPPPLEAMKLVGTEKTLSVADIKEFYDALGSFLHTSTLGQLKSGKVVDNSKIMDRCEKAFQLITHILNSPIWKINFGNFTELPECMNSNCKMPVRKRILPGSNVVRAECFECKTEYKIVVGEGNQVLW